MREEKRRIAEEGKIALRLLLIVAIVLAMVPFSIGLETHFLPNVPWLRQSFPEQVAQAQVEDLSTGYSRTDTLGTATSVREVFVWVYDANETTYTDETTGANNATVNSFPLIGSPSGDPVGDITYFGAEGQYSYLQIDTGTAGATWDNDSVTWKYWDGDSWDALAGISDGTNSFKTVGSQAVRWTGPTDWATTQVNEINAYWIAAEFTGTGKTVDTQPLGDQIWRGGRLFVTPDRIRATGVTFNEDTILYKSRATGGTADINDYFALTVDNITGGASPFFALTTVWAVTQGTDDLTAEDVAGRSWLTLHLVETASPTTVESLRLRQCRDGTLATSTGFAIEKNRRYYIHIHYDHDVGAHGTLYAYIFYDIAMTDAAGTLTLTLIEAKESYTYYGPLWSNDAGQSGTVSAIVGDVYLDSEPPLGMFAESDVRMPLAWDDEYTLLTFPTDWTVAKEANAVVEGAAWPGTSANASHIVANEGDGNDGYALIATTVQDYSKFVVEADIYLASLGDGKLRALFGARETSIGYYVQATVARSGASYYWRTRTSAGITNQTIYQLAIGFLYEVRISTCYTEGTGTWDYGASIHVRGGNGSAHEYAEWTLIESVLISTDHTINFHADEIFVGNRQYGFFTGEGGDCYVKDISYHDGGTFFPKLARGGAGDGTLVFAQSVRSAHGVSYGSCIEIFSSSDDGDTFTLVAEIGANATYDMAWPWVVWDSVNDEWLFIIDTRHAVDGNQAWLFHVSDPADMDGILLSDSEWMMDGGWLFPTRLIEDGELLVGIEIRPDPDPWVPTEEDFGRIELGLDYTLTNVAAIATLKLGYTALSEPRIYRRPSDNVLCAIVRYDSSGPRDEMMHVDLSGNGTSWSGGVWPGEDWSDISAGITAFVHGDYMYIAARDSQKQPWQSLVWQINPENMQLITERTWTDSPGFIRLWETGNGDIDASSVAGTHYLDTAFDYGTAQYRRVDTLVGLSTCPAATVTPDPIGSVSATFKGNITIASGANATYYAWVYDISSHANPLGDAPGDTDYIATGGNQTVGPGNYGTGSYSLLFEDLLPNTKYYIRFMTYTTGWCAGDEVEITTLEVLFPIVATLAATNIEETSATFNGNVTDVGIANVTDRGFVWSTVSQANPGNATPSASGYDQYYFDTGNWSAGVFNYSTAGGNLSEGTCYYFRATANNTAGWDYGNETTLLTKPDEPTGNSVDNFGNTTIDFSWTNGSGSANTTWRYGVTCPANQTDGTSAYLGSGTSANVTGLYMSASYCFVGWSIAEGCNETKYSDANVTFTQWTRPGNPTNLVANNTTDSTIDLAWTLGNASDTTMIRYSTGAYPANETDGTQAYFSAKTTTTVSGLACGTTYYFRAWAYSANSTYYSAGYAQDANATTACEFPTVITDAATAVEETQATFEGRVTAIGSGNVTSRGFVWDTVSRLDPGNVSPATSDYNQYWTEGGNWGIPMSFDYTTIVGNLTEGTCFYVRAYARNEESGDEYGEERQVFTKPDEPNGAAVTDQTANSISYSWNKGDGAGNTTWRYSTTGYPGNYTEGSSAYFGTGSSDIEAGLTEGTQYYFRGWSQASGCNSTIQYSDTYDQFTDYTLPGNVTNLVADNPTATTIDLEWTIGAGSNTTYIRGKQGSYPANRADGVLVGNVSVAGNTTVHNGLACEQDWYYRAWAWDAESGYYSSTYDQDANSTSNCTSPAVITTAPTLVEETTATLNGNITNTGNSDVTNYAFVWGTSSQAAPAGAPPGAYDTSWTIGSGNYTVGAYSRAITALSEGACYYFRFGANNTDGWVWGNETVLLTKPVEPSNLNVTTWNEDTISLSWTKGSGADNTITRYDTTGYPALGGGTLGANTTGTTATLSGLADAQIYYIRAWSWANESCGQAYSDSYDQLTHYTTPGNVTNCTAGNETYTSIYLEWTVGNASDRTVVRGSTVGYPASPTGDTLVVNTGANSTEHQGLTPNTQWFYTIWAYDSTGQQYANGTCQTSATTLDVNEPVVITVSGNATSCTEADLYGSVTSLGGGAAAITQRGFVYGLNCEADPGNSTAPAGSAWDSFTLEAGSWGTVTYDMGVSGLMGNTTYYLRAVVYNGSYWDYGNCTSFITADCGPCVAPSDLTATVQTETQVFLTWTPGGNASTTVVRRAFGENPTTATGALVYSGTGSNATDYVDMSTLSDDIYYCAWTLCSDSSYSANSTCTTTAGGGTVMYLGFFALCLGLTWFGFRGRYILWNIAAAISWIGFLAYWVAVPPSGVDQGSSTHVIVMLIPIAAAVAIMIWGLGYQVRVQTKYGGEEFQMESQKELFKFWGDKDEGEMEELRRAKGNHGSQQRALAHKARMRSALERSENRRRK